MKKVALMFLVAIIALARTMAAAGGGGTSTPDSSKPSSKPSGPSSSPTKPPGASSGSSTSDAPAASPSGSSDRMLQYTTKADCEAAGGMWTDSKKSCMKKK